MLTRTFALISASLHPRFRHNTGEGSPKPVQTSISIGQASRISQFFCYLISVICMFFPQHHFCGVKVWVLFMFLCLRCLAALNLSGFIHFEFLQLLRVICCRLNFWETIFPPRRDPYDYPTHSRPVPREPGPFPGQYNGPPASSRMPIPQSAAQPNSQRYYPSSPSAGRQQRPPLKQDVPPFSTVAYRGQQYCDPSGQHLEGYRQASPGRYTSPDRYGYSDDKQSDSRRKNPMIGAV